MAKRRRPSIDDLMPTPTPRRTLTGALTAAAQRITGRKIGRRDLIATGRGWQHEAWRLHKAVPEQRFIVNTLARRIGQARLYVGTVSADGIARPDPVDAENGGVKFAAEAAAIIAPIITAPNLTRMYVNLNVAGECWLVGIPPSLIDTDLEPVNVDLIDPPDLHWQVLSVSEVVPDMRGALTLKTGDTAGDIEVIPDDVYLIRVWTPDPELSEYADSPTRSLMPVLREIIGLTMHVSAQIDSRLAGAGILAIPQSASRAMRVAAGLPETSEEDPLTNALIESMMTPIADRDSAAALVPMVLSIPDESVDKLKHISFSSPLDEHAKDLREESIRRLALGQDAPPELLLGTANLNHWSSWSMQEDVVRSHLEPPLKELCDALTTQLLRPVLMDVYGLSEEAADGYVVWYDVDHLISRPTRGADALTLNSAGLLSAEATRAAMGFDETDAPATQDPAVATALSMLTQAPSLLQTLTLQQLVASIRAVLDGDTAPVLTPTIIDDAGVQPGPPAGGPDGN